MTDAAVDDLLNPWGERRALARQVKKAKTATLPHLKHWKYTPCEAHADLEAPLVDCEFRACGGDFFEHQKVALAWLYLNGNGMVASVPGSGKTGVTLGLCSLLKERGEMTRAVIVVQTPAVQQWLSEAHRFAPGLRTVASHSNLKKSERTALYSEDWDVMIVGYHLLQRDSDEIMATKPSLVVTDDVDPLLSHRNQTHKNIARLAAPAERVVVMNASNLQRHLNQIHAAMVPMGGLAIWGSLTAFERQYLRVVKTPIYVGGKRRYVPQTVGYQNLNHLKETLSPWVIRHGYEDLTDIRMPEIMPPQNVWLELYPEQRRMYEELREGVLRIITESGEKVKNLPEQAKALSMLSYGAQICAGIPALTDGEDGPKRSIKLDWLMERVKPGGVWEDRKVVVFMKNIGMIRAARARLDMVGVGHATIWGPEPDAQVRAAEIKRFWEDPECRVFMGTAAMERSLNLHVANIVVCLDTHLNPERMRQILGRVRRAGSRHDKVFVFNLFALDTQEAKYLKVLRQRAALVDAVWDEENAMYEKLSTKDLLDLIRP